MYNHPFMNPYANRYSLQHKVQFDIRFVFFRRRCENMEQMRVDDFKMDFDQEIESWYVSHTRDEMTKKPQRRVQQCTNNLHA